MPWIEAVLRGQKVFAHALPNGALDAEGGRVEVRYKANDGRSYRAAASNLVVAPGAKVLPEETCGPAEAAAPKARTAAAPSVTQPAAPSGAESAGGAVADRWIAYTDGACSGNPGPAGAGVIVVAPSGKQFEGFEFLGQATNNVGELAGILLALEAIPVTAREVVVHTDSKYAIGVLSKGWKAKANPELIAKTKIAMAKHARVSLVYVPGHAGVPLNERADQLAREAISSRKSTKVTITT